MTVKIYVDHDTRGREWGPDRPHEVQACEWILKKAWEEFQHLHELYAFIVNLHHPSADMVVIREKGLGVVEMKHVFGEIRVGRDGIWKAGPSIIYSKNHLNPREQVRHYAIELRQKILPHVLPAYMLPQRKLWNELKFQTAVCFTNSNAKLQTVKKYFEERHPDLEPWEDKFSIRAPDDFTEWVRALCFELHHNASQKFEVVCLEPTTIVKIATKILGCVEWEEMYPAMPDGEPYGYLILDDSQGMQIFILFKDETIIGRSHECHVVLPERYRRVSKRHCVIHRGLDGVRIADNQSRNGTFIKDLPVTTSVKLKHGTVVTLGGITTSTKACALRFELHDKSSLHTTITEQGTGTIKAQA